MVNNETGKVTVCTTGLSSCYLRILVSGEVIELKAILVDDEQMALDFLEHLLREHNDIEIVDKLTNPLSVKENVMQTNPDVVFLDINMPQVNGLELAEQILEMNPNIQIVFVTAYDDYALSAFEINALDYLLKPIQKERLKKTMKRLAQNSPLVTEHSSTKQDRLLLSVCGSFSIKKENGETELVSWRTSKVRELFHYLLHNKERLVRKSLLIELIWPGLDPEKAYAQLYTAIYHVRKALKHYPDYFKLENMTEGYILSTQNVDIDMELWQQKLEEAPPITQQTIKQYLEAMEYYTAPYFDDYDYWWAENDKIRLERLWYRTAMQIAKVYYSVSSYDKAKEWYKRINERYPEQEEVHFSLMKLYSFINETEKVDEQYLFLKHLLKSELATTPNPEITSWYKQWKKYHM